MIKLTDVLKASNGQLYGESVNEMFTDFCFNAQKATDGELYIAVVNHSMDIAEAIQRGVSGVICTSPPSVDTRAVTVIVAQDPMRAVVRMSQAMASTAGIHDPTPSMVQVDTEALAHNVQLIRQHIDDGVALMAVVKANGYGHGAVTVARTALRHGASFLAVANLAEAMVLRDAGIHAPILVLSYVPPAVIGLAIQHDIHIALFDLGLARQYAQVAHDMGRTLRVHVKLDTGMGRLGLLPNQVEGVFQQLVTLSHLEIEGLMTHFSMADTDPDFTAKQLVIFKECLASVRAMGVDVRYVHTSNSPATIGVKDDVFNLVRPGLLLYGLQPSQSRRLDGLQPVMSWKTVVAQVKTLPSQSTIGYGNTYRTQGEEVIAVIPVGYADGLRRAPKTWREVLIRGQRAPIVGRVSMEKTTVNVTHIEGVSVGDEVVLLGQQGDDAITADDVAGWWGTINYEVVTSILPRVPRV